jgi:hypothetical protein
MRTAISDRHGPGELGARGGAVVQVFDAGARITRTGAHDVFVPAGSLRAVETTRGIAGEYVGRDGIAVLTRLVDAAAALIVEPAPPAAHSATKETS